MSHQTNHEKFPHTFRKGTPTEKRSANGANKTITQIDKCSCGCERRTVKTVNVGSTRAMRVDVTWRQREGSVRLEWLFAASSRTPIPPCPLAKAIRRTHAMQCPGEAGCICTVNNYPYDSPPLPALHSEAHMYRCMDCGGEYADQVDAREHRDRTGHRTPAVVKTAARRREDETLAQVRDDEANAIRTLIEQTRAGPEFDVEILGLIANGAHHKFRKVKP